MRVYLPVRLSPFDPRDGNVKDPEPPPGPLVPGAEPDLAWHPGRVVQNVGVMKIKSFEKIRREKF
jgi:hypothetical protein